MKTATLDVGGMLSMLDYQAVGEAARPDTWGATRDRQHRLEQRDSRV